MEKTQPFIEKLNSRGKELLSALPEGDKEYLKNQLDTLKKLQESVIRSAVDRQEELVHKILQQQDFDTQLQACFHVVNEVEASVCNEFNVEADTGAMKEKLALCEVCLLLYITYLCASLPLLLMKVQNKFVVVVVTSFSHHQQ